MITKNQWGSINWNGTIAQNVNCEMPSDELFKGHFEQLLNVPEENMPPEIAIHDAPYLPLTDDQIQPIEVENAMKTLKSSKSGGLSGIPPGLLRILPVQWIIFMAHLFTHLLVNAAYPENWKITKLIILFKKGPRMDPGNYRGISLMDSTAKLYDIILNKRLTLWMKPDREQVGAQKARGCTEHLITLRLLIDYAQSKRKKLFMIFVDFSKAYDRVPRDLMLRKRQQLGCGGTMTAAIAAMYRSTRMLLRTTMITSTIGVRQGSPTSCLLFTLIVNDLIRNLKEQCAPDSYLGWLHSLMLMDDTIIFASTRERALQKVRILRDFCKRSGMVVNNSKTKFMVINGKNDDYSPIRDGPLSISNCVIRTPT